MGSERPYLILLVFGVITRPTSTIPSRTQVELSKSIEGGMITAEKEQSRRRISFGLKTPGAPAATRSSYQLENLPSGSKFLVYRTNNM